MSNISTAKKKKKKKKHGCEEVLARVVVHTCNSSTIDAKAGKS
jgi:hypothetical protein